MRSRHMHARHDERGAALVEFALVLPVLMLFVFGIVSFGQAYSARIELTSAVREGVRVVALGGASATVADAADRTKEAAPGLTASQISVNATLCSGTPAPLNGTVTASYPFTYDIPFFGTRSHTLTAKGVMRCGG
jgi:Flp pilus assembly protein TadG